MSEFDFKGALEALHNLNKDLGFINPDSHYGKHCATTALALKIADRLQKGAPTKEMCEVGRLAALMEGESYDGIFKAMATQLIKEIESELRVK